MAAAIIFVILFWLAIVAFYLYCAWKLYEKAGREGWEGIIPIYNLIILFKIVGKPWWWIFLMIIPIVNIVFIVWTYNMLSKSFGKDEAFTVGLVILGFIFQPILALSKNIQYQGPYGDPEAYKAFQEKKSQWDFDKNKPQ